MTTSLLANSLPTNYLLAVVMSFNIPTLRLQVDDKLEGLGLDDEAEYQRFLQVG